ncbi:Cyclopentanone 1,2-monooxygenase (CPMO) [Bulinus truncatus]|nr:Cyclopentanone 1,2-monooxygenase (CPMO) [Bulinus truncatus]
MNYFCLQIWFKLSKNCVGFELSILAPVVVFFLFHVTFFFGCSGLAAIKSCVEADLEPVCFESSAYLGGLWRFSEEPKNSRGCVMESTVVNTSKEMMSFSDFPAPREFPNFMHHTKVLNYFQMYSERFDLVKYIRFNHEVISVTLTDTSDDSQYDNNHGDHDDGENNSQQATSSNQDNSFQTSAPRIQKLWRVAVMDLTTKLTSDQYFDFVLICTGHHAEPNTPYFPGQGIFKGKILHSRDFRKGSDVKGHRHVVVGVGNSGCDVAVELSRRGQVFLCSRRGTWVMHRLQRCGLPADVTYMSRLVFAVALSLPHWLLNHVAAWFINQKIDHRLYGLCQLCTLLQCPNTHTDTAVLIMSPFQSDPSTRLSLSSPQHGPFSTHPTVNDELPNRIASGQVTIKPNIDCFTTSGIQFDDGSIEEDISTVILATGYKIGFPFLDRSLLNVKGNQVQLYKYMFPPNLTPPSMAVIGCVQPGGALAPISEMQCRIAVKVFKGDVKIPNQREMMADIDKTHRSLVKRYVQTQRHTVQVDYIPYMDELADMIGCKPKWVSLLVSDPKLALTCLLGPCTAYQYRLFGPNSWPGAREAILHQMDRIRWPFNSRRQKQLHQVPEVNVTVIFFVIVTLCIGYIMSVCMLWN